jgi:bifunctional DNA-binding transcriptional regulator/antitoxin component of YhaV-PrlF toxin-antitoxin module
MTFLATITSKNQLTLPRAAVDLLAWQGVRRVLVSLDNQKLTIEPVTSRVEELAGKYATLATHQSHDLKEIEEKTQKIVAAEIAREGI